MKLYIPILFFLLHAQRNKKPSENLLLLSHKAETIRGNYHISYFSGQKQSEKVRFFFN